MYTDDDGILVVAVVCGSVVVEGAEYVPGGDVLADRCRSHGGGDRGIFEVNRAFVGTNDLFVEGSEERIAARAAMMVAMDQEPTRVL